MLANLIGFIIVAVRMDRSQRHYDSLAIDYDTKCTALMRAEMALNTIKTNGLLNSGPTRISCKVCHSEAEFAHHIPHTPTCAVGIASRSLRQGVTHD